MDEAIDVKLLDLGHGQKGVRVTVRIPEDVFYALVEASPEHIRTNHARMLNDFLYENLKFSVSNIQKRRKENKDG